MKFTNQNMQAGFYYRNRSGYEGSTFLIDSDGSSISAKSNKFQERVNTAVRYPIVLLDNESAFDAELVDGIWTIRHHYVGPDQTRKAKAIVKWYLKNDLEVIESLHHKEYEYVQIKVSAK